MTTDNKIEWGAGTPGPWIAIDYGNNAEWEVVKPDPTIPDGHWYVAIAFDAADDGSAEANARAIAEVPAMYVSLEELIQAIKDENPLAYQGAIAKAEAILNRIDGETK